MVARPVKTWQEFDVCATLGLDAFVGNLHLTVREDAPKKGMSPSQALILQLMDMVRKNADIPALEAVLRRDAALSFRLLRYINSAGFGLAVEVTSLRHAVGIIGYSPLYRWLTLLLATASNSENGAALMQTAVIRGRFAELLGMKQLPKSEAENLFVAGMFSLLDRLLGIPLKDAMNQISLPESVSEAILTRKGAYGPFLALTEACEHKNGGAGDLADALLISPQTVNQAHLAAMAWTQNFTS
jgi:EAL and modified HD-GYP domain-containing signal transduction protein